MSATQKVMGHVYAIFTILVWGGWAWPISRCGRCGPRL